MHTGNPQPCENTQDFEYQLVSIVILGFKIKG
jgi:hypothetical protein